MSGFPSLFARIAQAGGLPPDVTPHVLRHSFASLAGDLGYSEPTIAALIGHQGRSVTSRYVRTRRMQYCWGRRMLLPIGALELMGAAPEGNVVAMPNRRGAD